MRMVYRFAYARRPSWLSMLFQVAEPLVPYRNFKRKGPLRLTSVESMSQQTRHQKNPHRLEPTLRVSQQKLAIIAFNTEFNLSFGAPKTDTCNKCDSLHVSIQAENDEQKRHTLQVQQDLHHRKAKSSYESLKADGDIAKQNSNVTVITFDFQQVLPCPYLTTSVVFYNIDILESVPTMMKSRAFQLVKKLKANKDVIGWNDHGQIVFEGRTIPGTNVIDLINDTLCQRKNFNPAGWQLFAKALGRLNVPEGIIRNEERLNMVKAYRNKPTDTPLTLLQLPLVTGRVKTKTKRARKKPYKWHS